MSKDVRVRISPGAPIELEIIMTVGELIEKLQQFDQNKIVKTVSDEYGQVEFDIIEIAHNHYDDGPLII